ncbi:hypothetical protein CSA08_01310 [Candidatus Gracilibacteria bacterium]|nr:MAG: hypothetical protein CSA08_01310 [Candidatus Gracilibacteria bacterium]
MKMLKIITVTLTLFLLTSVAHAYEVKKVDVKDDKTMDVSLNDEVQFTQGKITGDIKVLKDISISMSSKDFEELSKVVLTLDKSLEKNANYSLLSIFGADGSIDFTTGENISGVELVNSESVDISEQGIVKVNIVNPTTVEVYFSEDLEGEEFEFKLLKEVNIDSLSSIGKNNITVKLSSRLESATDYMLVLVSLTDSNGLELSFDEDIFDFSTPDELVKTKVTEDEAAALSLNSAGDETNLEDNDNFIDNVASNVTETPDTGAETWVLLFGTFILNTFYYFYRKKSIKA